MKRMGKYHLCASPHTHSQKRQDEAGDSRGIVAAESRQQKRASLRMLFSGQFRFITRSQKPANFLFAPA
jgi:hypothetical protein